MPTPFFFGHMGTNSAIVRFLQNLLGKAVESNLYWY